MPSKFSYALAGGAAILLSGGGLLLHQAKQDNSSFFEKLEQTTASGQEALAPFVSAFHRGKKTLTNNVMTLRATEITGNYRVSEIAILKAAGLLEGASTLHTSLSARETAITSLPWIQSAKIDSRLYPARLRINVEEEEPWLVAEYEGHSWLVSANGLLLQTLSSLENTELIMEISELPRLDGLGPHPEAESFLSSPNERFSYAVRYLQLFELAGGFPFPVDRFTILPAGELQATPLSVAEHPEVVLRLQSLEEAETAREQLLSVLSDLESRGERARRIDLRFQNQVIVE